eukprot:TRINITY_DN10201_c0_g1_i1.p2 TRINITY_DN10201_c0_g1~~TRINITY_DN10201_c0_g1_i1.p2  ORF type:complete len:155 (+),score=23.57 TRINITY_DN10201_c0_g1_i1:450-914(+)
MATAAAADSNGAAATDHSRWQVLYPIYVNSKKTIAEGRRIAAAKAAENPSIQEMVDSCTFLKIPVHAELDKAYSRDFFQRGRIRVQLKKPDGSLHNPEIPNKVALMLRLGSLIPKHHGRNKKDSKDKDKDSSQAGAAHGDGGKDKKGKGGKKKR